MVDVKDTARHHLAALIDSEVENERILAPVYSFDGNGDDTLACLRKLYSENGFPRDIENDWWDLGRLYNRRREELLKRFERVS